MDYTSFRDQAIKISNCQKYPHIWKWNEAKFGYLSLNISKPSKTYFDKSENNDMNDFTEKNIEDNDDHLIYDNNTDSVYYLNYDIHIIYSPIYNSPVLYFNISNTNGQLLHLNEIVTELNSHFNSIKLDESFITQIEHPVLGIPFYHIHPCNTPNILKESKENQLLNWLSWVSPFFDLSITTELYEQLNKH